jgi:hypothetical protein
MAKGDAQKVQNAVDYRAGTAQNLLNNMRGNVDRQNQQFEDKYLRSSERQEGDYANLMNQGQSVLDRTMGAPLRDFGAYGGYKNFAETGGYSPEDVQNIRARAVSPIRGIYANANREVDRSKALQAGYAPNYAASKAKMAREQSYALSDVTTNAEAAIADQIRQGKLAGLGGMTNIDQALQQAELSKLGLGNDALRTMGSIYSATPGQSQMYGNQLLQSTNQQLGVEGLQNEIMKAVIQGQLGRAQVPGNFQQVMGNIGSVVGLAGDAANIFNPFKFGGGGNSPFGPYSGGYKFPN